MLAPADCLDVRYSEVTDSNQEGVGQKQMMQSRTEFLLGAMIKLCFKKFRLKLWQIVKDVMAKTYRISSYKTLP